MAIDHEPAPTPDHGSEFQLVECRKTDCPSTAGCKASRNDRLGVGQLRMSEKGSTAIFVLSRKKCGLSSIDRTASNDGAKPESPRRRARHAQGGRSRRGRQA